MQKDAIRSFFACELTSDNLNKINKVAADLKPTLPNLIRWVNTENIHITLKFIGEFYPDDLVKIQSSLNQALLSFRQFEIQISQLGVFPSYSKPRVIWVGINSNEQLNNLVKILNHETEKLGYPSEKRPFSAHLTLGRVKDYASAENLKTIGSVVKSRENCIFGSQNIKELCFFQSQLTPQGSIYKKLFISPLSA